MEYLFAYGAGLLTLINPCVVPVLPIVLTSALQASRHGPAALALGMSLSFVVFGMAVTVFGHAIGLTPDTLSKAGAVLMMGFGAVLLVPQFSNAFTTATAGVAASADSTLNTVDHTSLQGQFLGGLLLGLVWSPCIGPTLGGAIALASQGESLTHATIIMIAFAAGVSTLILGLGYGARSALGKHQATLRAIAAKSRPILGGVFFLTGLALFFNVHHMIEIWLLGILPPWLLDLSVAL
ncbi:cytochrome c biogenesis protein CcdA [uncultured Shimia sp.]|uniref:cytochrome c biogenesis CcdA family protein n=1 Tax=uncultured Shimia sp. TaxID=573152 RepID=UPI00260395DE|nr:cytochrome c biogenesis protein CcdA [uncultured Shimia sp.]